MQTRSYLKNSRGSQLKQEELAEAFEASRIPIREAFQILENQGLIIRLATRRITVTELDEEQICLIYSMISEMTKKHITMHFRVIGQVLEENPTIQVVIDLHRDGVPEGKHLVTEINGKPTSADHVF